MFSPGGITQSTEGLNATKGQRKEEFALSQVVLVVKNPPANAGSVSKSGRFPGGEHGNPLQYSCLENPMDRGAWRAIVHRVTKS